MARRTFDVIDICEILVHWHAGRPENEVAGSLGLSRNTVRKYVAAAEAAGMVPGGPAVSQERWAELAREWFPELADTRLQHVEAGRERWRCRQAAAVVRDVPEEAARVLRELGYAVEAPEPPPPSSVKALHNW